MARNKETKKRRSTMANGQPFFGGIPTDIDVRRMRDAFPKDTLKEGKLITYEEIENVIGSKRKEFRFKTVTNRWRKLVEKECEIVIGCVPSKGLIVNDDHEKVDLMGTKLRSAARACKRSLVVSSRIETKNLTAEEKKEFTHRGACAGAMIASARIRGQKALPSL
jgi:hypothetical protein